MRSVFNKELTLSGYKAKRTDVRAEPRDRVHLPNTTIDLCDIGENH